MPTKTIVTFLDYVIVNTGNGDGWVLKKPDTSYENLWECHLGNYHNVDDAKRSAIQYFMIARPNEFSAQVHARMNGNHIYMDYYKFIDVLKKEGIETPAEIGHSDDMNFVLTFNGKMV